MKKRINTNPIRTKSTPSIEGFRAAFLSGIKQFVQLHGADIHDFAIFANRKMDLI
jgi:hypothetical protein